MQSNFDLGDDDNDDLTRKLREARYILGVLDFPRAQLNDRSALTLLALLNLTPDKSWDEAEAPLMGITPIIDWGRVHYGMHYAPNTRETFRRQTMHQFVAAALAVNNPDKPDRPINSPKWCYQVDPQALELLRTYGTDEWESQLALYQSERQGLQLRYAKEREMQRVAVAIAEGKEINLSPGAHSELIRAILLDFGSRYVRGGKVVYVGDTGDKWGYFDAELLKELGVDVGSHGKMPDVVIFHPDKNWLLLIESVTSHGPVDSKRHEELADLFSASKAAPVYVTAFPSRALMKKYLTEISWETEVWIAESPDHLIHFNGERFLGPYNNLSSRSE